MAERTSDAHRLALMPSGRQGQVKHGTDLLQAARSLGVELESICGGRQTCGKCQITLEQGHFPKHGIHSSSTHLSPVKGREARYLEEHNLQGRRLACAAEVLGDVLISVPEESQAHKQIIAKAATERAIEVDPPVRQVYVEVPRAQLGDNRGDWERLQAALAEQWDLKDLSPDPTLLTALQPALRQGDQAVTATLWQDREVLRVDPGYREGVYGLAVDIGSTTVAAHLCDLRTGELLATQAAMNPQVRYGEDLMSRVSYAAEESGGLARLHRAILRALNDLAERAARTAGIDLEDIMDAVLVGNTVMHHLLLGINPVELGGAPFALAVDSPLDVKARELGLKLHPAARAHILPLIAGHVGADNSAVLLAEAPHARDEISLVIDVGTNAEIQLGDREAVMVASSPTGPAFEGAQVSHGQRAAPGAIERVRIDPETLAPRVKLIGEEAWMQAGQTDPSADHARATGLCGSGIIEAVAEMYLAGIINHEGHFLPEAADRSTRVQFQRRAGAYRLVDAEHTAAGSPIWITQEDIRAIQLAKAALYAGAKLLMARRGVRKVDRITLAGAFGSYISPRHAMILGMIPDCDLSRVVAVGNAAGDGARIALLNREQRREAARLARWVQYVETPLAKSFQAEFVDAMALPHARDPFPHLNGQLPRPTRRRPRKRRHRIRKRE